MGVQGLSGGLGGAGEEGSWKLRDVEMFGLDQGTISGHRNLSPHAKGSLWPWP